MLALAGGCCVCAITGCCATRCLGAGELSLSADGREGTEDEPPPGLQYTFAFAWAIVFSRSLPCVRNHLGGGKGPQAELWPQRSAQGLPYLAQHLQR